MTNTKHSLHVLRSLLSVPARAPRLDSCLWPISARLPLRNHPLLPRILRRRRRGRKRRRRRPFPKRAPRPLHRRRHNRVLVLAHGLQVRVRTLVCAFGVPVGAARTGFGVGVLGALDAIEHALGWLEDIDMAFRGPAQNIAATLGHARAAGAIHLAVRRWSSSGVLPAGGG